MQQRKVGLVAGAAVVVIAVTVIAGSATLFAIRPDARPRSAYRSDSSSTDQWLLDSGQESEHARGDADGRVGDAIDLALRVAGYPNPDALEADTVHAFYRDSSSVTVIVRKAGLYDDSVEARETRVDLVRGDGTWRIEWVGERYRCQRTGYRGWVTSLCP